MSWAVLTNETTASKMLTPGGFEPEKRMGYLISAYQNPAVDMSWEELNAIDDIDKLKALCYTDKNLCFIDTHLQFYKQNSAAATALGMAAVQKVAHATLESNGYYLDVKAITNSDAFTFAGKIFDGFMEIDRKFNDADQLIGRTLGEFVAMFADAVKDPVANLMNINNTTMPIVTSLIRLGIPFETAALFISQPVIREVLNLYNSENVINFVRLSDVIQRRLDKIKDDYNIEDESLINSLNEITTDELINGLRPSGDEQSEMFNYKVLKFFQRFDSLSRALKSPTYATRFNSISNAVGPLVIDNLIKEYKAENGDFENFYYYNSETQRFESANFGDILQRHPILGSFYQTLDLSDVALDEMPANSPNFRKMLLTADKDESNDMKRILYGDRKILSELSDYYQSYLLIASGAIPLEATAKNKYQGLKYYIEQFPADFMRGNAKEVFKGNALIDAIRLDVQRDRAVLKVDITGLTTQDKEKLGDAWADLYRSGERGKKLAEHLFYYNFWRTGIGFSPKSFMNLFPTVLKSNIQGYNSTFNVHSGVYADNVSVDMVLEQYVRSNADNNKLAPRVKIGGKEGTNPTITNGDYMFYGKDYVKVGDKPYIKTKQNGNDILLKRISKDSKTQTAHFVEVSMLGNNGEYYEASLSRDYKPLAQTSKVTEQKKDAPMSEVDLQHQIDDVPVHEDNSLAEQKKRAGELREMLLEMSVMSGKTEEQAVASLEAFKKKTAQEKVALKETMQESMRNFFDQIGVEYNEELIEDLYSEMC